LIKPLTLPTPHRIDVKRLSCRVGSTNQYAGGRIVTVESVVVHPDYYQLTNNLAVITLSSALAYTERIKAIPVAASGEALPAEGSEVSVAGWGRTADGTTSYKIRELADPHPDRRPLRLRRGHHPVSPRNTV